MIILTDFLGAVNQIINLFGSIFHMAEEPPPYSVLGILHIII